MPDENFSPHNELEKRLIDLVNGALSERDFVNALMLEQVFMPVRDEKSAIKGFQKSTRATPLVVADEDDTPVLFLFTSPERAKPWVAEYPDFSGGLLAEFSWVLERVDPGAGIALNPGWEVGFDLDAATVSQLKQTVAAPGNA
jgi:hypothetical protein